jgi:hypothetical protein
VLFLNAVLLMDMALLPFAAPVLAHAFRDGRAAHRRRRPRHGVRGGSCPVQRHLVVRPQRPRAARRHGRRRWTAGGSKLALARIGAGTLLGALLPFAPRCAAAV